MKLLTFLKFPVSKYSPTTGTIKALFPLVDSFFFISTKWEIRFKICQVLDSWI